MLRTTERSLPALTWSSSNEDIATVQGDGASAVIEGLREGEVTITVSGGSVSAEFSVKVNPSPAATVVAGRRGLPDLKGNGWLSCAFFAAGAWCLTGDPWDGRT